MTLLISPNYKTIQVFANSRVESKNQPLSHNEIKCMAQTLRDTQDARRRMPLRGSSQASTKTHRRRPGPRSGGLLGRGCGLRLYEGDGGAACSFMDAAVPGSSEFVKTELNTYVPFAVPVTRVILQKKIFFSG